LTKHVQITINCNPITWFAEQKGNICVLTIAELKLEAEGEESVPGKAAAGRGGTGLSSLPAR